MCQQLRPQTTILGKVKSHNNNVHVYNWIWPLPIPVAILLLSLLPTSCYLNRGYTVWFHLLSIIYLLTQSTFIRKVLILQGIGICLGWYAAIATDWFVDNTFCHTLYRNMPESIMFYMIKEDESESSYIILNTYTAMAMKILSHVLDTVGHPGLAYLFYRLHSNEFRRTNDDDNSRSIWRDILSWEVIVSAWHLSRIWSMVHSYYNTASVKLWYYGHDIYKLNNLNAYFIAYVVEGLCFVVAILYRLHWDRDDDKKNRCIENIVSGEDKPPKLVHSESAVSTTSLM